MDLSPSSPLPLLSDTVGGDARPPGRPHGLSLYAPGQEALLAQLGRGRGLLIATPNLDHLRLLHRSAALRRAYAGADVVLNDSRFLDRLCLKGRALTLPGSELAPLMLARAPAGTRALVVGCDETVKADLRARYPGVSFTFIEPTMGFIRRRAERRDLVRAALSAAPDLAFVCTGAPQSELLAAQFKRAGLRADILCCGSAFRFLAGAAVRAPAWTRRLGAEWAWRFLSEPRTRQRYVADALFLLRRAPAFLALRLKGRARFGRYEVGIG